MKTFALIALSLSLLSAGAIAQETAPVAPPATPQIKVTVDSVVTNYSLTPRNGELVVSCVGGAIYNQEKSETQVKGNVHIKYGESFDVYAEKAFVKWTNGGVCITLQSDGKIDSIEGKQKVTQFVTDGTRIEIPGSK